MKSLVFGVAIALAASAASAAPFSVDVTGIWSAATPDPLGNPNTLEGLGTEDLRWGIPADGQKSGYDFIGHHEPIADVTTLLSGPLQFGAMLHRNWPVELVPGAINSATLDLSIDIAGNVLNYQLLFEHNETPNADNPCAIVGGAPPAGGCRDVVTFPTMSDVRQVVLDGAMFNFSLIGFVQNSALVSQFVTNEQSVNSAGIFGAFSRATPVPEPAVALVFGLGLIAAGALRRLS